MNNNPKQVTENLKTVFNILTIAFYRYLSENKNKLSNKGLELNPNVSINDTTNNKFNN